MSKSVKRVALVAAELGLSIEIRRMGQSTRTAEDAAAACGCSVGQIVKSLIFKGVDGDLILLLVAGNNRVDLDRAAEVAGTQLSRADADEVRSRTGFAIGGVSPIGHLETPRIFMDQDLMEHPSVWAAAGAPDAVFEITPAALQDATRATIDRLA